MHDNLTVTFSEAVQGVSANSTSGTCAGTVQLPVLMGPAMP